MQHNGTPSRSVRKAHHVEHAVRKMPGAKKVQVIGIDWSTEAKKVGLARGLYANGHMEVRDVRQGSSSVPPAATIEDWCRSHRGATILAIDAPLGWPGQMGEVLSRHVAGASLEVDSVTVFRRRTDQRIHALTGRIPLAVGADRIARTAVSALSMLGYLRQRLDRLLPLAWDRRDVTGSKDVWAIEVYPAATLSACSLPFKNYKDLKDQSSRDRREEILDGLRTRIDLGGADLSSVPPNCNPIDHPDALDALVCLLAGMHFLQDDSLVKPHPDEQSLARKEGWIWAMSNS